MVTIYAELIHVHICLEKKFVRVYLIFRENSLRVFIMASFENVWRRIRAHEGETFYTIQQREFTYSIKKDQLFPSRTVYCIAKSNFKIAYRMVPIDGPGIIASTL